MLKKITCILLSLFVLSVFILQSNIYFVFASDNDFTLSKSYDNTRNGFALSSSESSNAVNNKGDIYTSDHLLMFMYTPTDSYNWTTYAKNTVLTLHLSDSQLKAILMASTPFENLFYMIQSLSNTETIRAVAKGLGIAFSGKSSVGTELLDTITGNYNYLDSINYDNDTQTMTFDSSSVDKLREEIKKYYYDSIGIVKYKASGNFSSYINSRDFTHLFEYDEDLQEAYNKISKYKYALCDRYRLGSTDTSEHSFLWDSSDYLYLSEADGYVGRSTGNWCSRLMSYSNNKGTNFVDTTVSYTYYGISSGSYSTFSSPVTGLFWNPKGSYYNYIYPCSSSEKTNIIVGGREYSVNAYEVSQYYPFEYYSYDGSPLLVFKSFSSMYNYLNGDQNAFLSSEIKKTGEDITFSIKDMNENLGNKMDTLIDSINSNKSNMSADELQNAIDKGLEDLNKNTEDIKDNTSDILDTLKEQNNILLQILGVTEYIAYQNDKYNNTYTKADMSNLFKKSFNRVSDAVLYGEKVDDDNENTVDRSKFSYHNGIFGHFPFSVPYQLYEWLKVFQAEPECPEFTYHYGFLIGISKDNDEYDKYKITFNLSAYDSWREVAASLLKLSFTLTMAIGTYKKFKGEL